MKPKAILMQTSISSLDLPETEGNLQVKIRAFGGKENCLEFLTS